MRSICRSAKLNIGVYRRNGPEGACAASWRDVPGVEADGGAVAKAWRTVCRHEGIAARAPQPAGGGELSLEDILDSSDVRVRRVRLSTEDRWWRGDSGAMLAFRRGDDRPVALLPGVAGRYRVHDPVSGRSWQAGPETHRELRRDAWFPYWGMPADRAVGPRELFRSAGANLASDVIRLGAAGMAAGALTLAPAVAVGVLIDRIIPSGGMGPLLRFTAVLAALALAAALLHLLRGTALMRLEGRVAARLDAALWDRLLRLNTGFFRRYTAGELAVRAMSFRSLRDRVAGAAVGTLLSTLFLLPAVTLLFYYNAALGWLTLGLGLAALAVTAVFGVLQYAPQRRATQASRQVAGELLQLLTGIRKVRSAVARHSVFAAWARLYRQQKQAEIDSARFNEHLTAFVSSIPALAGAALFFVALQQGPEQLAMADFLAVYAASMMFFSSIAMLGYSIEAMANVMPYYEQTVPILEAAPEAASGGRAKIKLEGQIRFDRVDFRYSEDGPMVLRGVTIQARPGEFIAVVGESGAGKSTLVRLALGLETPVSGAVYYDERNLEHLDHHDVRRQVGVVIQDGDVQPGNVLTNIVGATERYTVDDAWRAARQAAVDADIASMPMGMYTPMGETAANFSGGQSQRIRVAAALVRNPRILFLDEATSWLDTRSQARTMEGIRKSTTTRIVIAHRLSTIREANRIYVLDAGRVVQEGRFDDLIEAEGLFRDLALRQMV